MPSAVPPTPAPRLEIAAELLTADVPTCAPGDTADEIRRGLLRRRYESVHQTAVVRDGTLVGLIPVEDLLAARGDARAESIMDVDPPRMTPGVDQEVVAWHAVHHHQSGLAVVDADGRFLGLIPAYRLLEVLLHEHDEDLARIGGFLRGSAGARSAVEEPIARRLWHRLPWLLVGLAGAVLAAAIVGGFEEQLSRNVLLAFFIPGIVYMADAVGTQTETLVIRGLSVGVSIRRVVVGELLTGVVVGAILGAVFLPIGLLAWGDAEVAVSVSLALFSASSVATLVAMALPTVLHHLKVDPAFGSGPLATVVQDLLSILIYFAIALAIVG
jgi:magnesium transporter